MTQVLHYILKERVKVYPRDQVFFLVLKKSFHRPVYIESKVAATSIYIDYRCDDEKKKNLFCWGNILVLLGS
jgi:hypothetical protein